MPKNTKPKKMKTFRIETEIQDRLKEVAKSMNLSESWLINNALLNQMPKFERMAKQNSAQAA